MKTLPRINPYMNNFITPRNNYYISDLHYTCCSCIRLSFSSYISYLTFFICKSNTAVVYSNWVVTELLCSILDVFIPSECPWSSPFCKQWKRLVKIRIFLIVKYFEFNNLISQDYFNYTCNVECCVNSGKHCLPCWRDVSGEIM